MKCLIFLLILLVGKINAQENEYEKIFTWIYDTGQWGFNDEGRGYSGDGSTVREAKPYMDFLRDFLRTHQIESVIDIGCGDWTFSQHLDWRNIHYLGVDVVKSVIESDIEKFSKPNITFMQADILSTSLPSADLLICKDVLQHLTYEDISLFLQQLSKYKHCLITNDYGSIYIEGQRIRENSDISTGKYRPIDLTLPPFNLKAERIFSYQSRYTFKEVLYIHSM
ncbi:MAG TPA: class I SAM-dependent methyltransferase [Chlamydiales bacterium]|nr:class I SAM-dependent methyltransferase [Chlamydiales bacterium]